MADKKQLRLLKEGGVEAWNKWRMANSEVRVDLSGADLREANLRDANLWSADLGFAKLSSAKLSSADLINADLSYANLNYANLNYANLSNANLHNANLSNAKLCEADLRSTDLRSTDLRFAKLIDANLIDADFRSADLSNADFRSADLSNAKLHNAKLRNADLRSADLIDAKLIDADFRSADLSNAKLIDAKLRSADLSNANLIDANLRSADLSFTKLNNADLINADLSYADLRYAKLIDAKLRNTNLDASLFYDTILAKVNLFNAIGLDKIKHEGPSELGLNTLQLSQGQLPEIFLKGCGLSDWEIAASKLYNPNLTPTERTDLLYEIDRLQTDNPFQLRQVFISYTEADGRFVDRIEKNFDAQGIRFWRDVHHGTAGPLDKVIERAIDHSPVFLLILSERSVSSDWVEAEVTIARELEKDEDQHIICPIAIDYSWKDCQWSPKLRTQIEKYNILDFSQWEDEAYFEQQYAKLLDGLNSFYLRG